MKMKRTRRGIQVHRSEKKKWSGQQMLKLAGAGFGGLCVLAVFLFLAYQGLSRAVFFQVEEVNVAGCERVTVKQVLAWSGLDVQTNLWMVRSARIREKLEAQDWIEKVDVRRNWPNKIAIFITERVPAALVTRKTGLYYVDEKGVVFAEALAGDDHDYPVITGLGEGEMNEGENGQLLEALEFIACAGNGAVTLPKQNISEIHLAGEKGLVLYMADNSFPIRLGNGDMKTKYGRLTRVLAWLYRKKQVEQASYIDMNYLAGVDSPESNRERVLVRFAES